jgi:type VI secretion system secreted protein Hcp
MRVRWMKGLVACAVLAVGGVPAVSTSADGRDGGRGHDIIKACVLKRSGEARIVAPDRSCRENEMPVVWNIEGPSGRPGPVGPPGATGAPGRDGRDGRDGKDGGGPAPSPGPIGALSIEEIHPPPESSPILSVAGGLSVGQPQDSGGGVGKVSFQDITLTKAVDQFSPKEYMFGAMGRTIKKVEIDVFRQGTQDVELNYRLLEVYITSVQQSGGGGQAALESLSLNFARIEITFTPSGGSSTTFCYDVKLNKGC